MAAQGSMEPGRLWMRSGGVLLGAWMTDTRFQNRTMDRVSQRKVFPEPGERTFEGYVNNNVPQNVETKLFTHSSGYNTNPRNDGHCKRFGTEPNKHGIIGPHVHQPTRNINPNNGVITGKPGTKTKNHGVTIPRAKDIKQRYEYLENGKYHCWGEQYE